MQIWTGTQKADDKIIALLNKSIFKANPNPSEIDQYVFDLKTGNIPTAKAIEIPINYIKQITLEEGKNYFEVHFGAESTEHFTIIESNQRREVFEFLKQNLPAESMIEQYSGLKAAKKPLIAALVVSAIFAWTLTLAIGMQNGDEYDVMGERRSIAGIVIILANLGVANNIIIFGILLGIALIAFIRKYRNPPKIHRLILRR